MKEILRYLGYRGEPDSQMKAQIEECAAEMDAVISVKSCSQMYLLESADGYPAISGHVFHSENLARNLRGCSFAYLMAVTLGNGPDRLLRRHSVESMSRAMICQAIASARVEEACDRENKKIIQHARRFSLCTRPRFSPGYGDLPLDVQKDFFALLDITRQTGITLTGGMAMAPSKSVTAIIGASYEKTPCVMQGCEACSMYHACMFSRKGENK